MKRITLHQGDDHHKITLERETQIDVLDEQSNGVQAQIFTDGVIIIRGIGNSDALHVRPTANNEVVVSTFPVDLTCGERHPAYNDYGSCYLQRGHEGDHRAHGHNYWTWSTSDENPGT